MKGETALFLRANLVQVRFTGAEAFWLKAFAFSDDAIEESARIGLLPVNEKQLADVHLRTPALGESWRCCADVNPEALEQAGFMYLPR
jgi:hypothetical protein